VISQFLLEVNNPTANNNVLTDNFNNIIINAANKTFPFKQFTKKKRKKKYKQKWFNGNCHFFKRELNNFCKKLKQHPDHFYLRTSFHRLRKEYKQLWKKIKYDFFKSIVDELDSLHENDPNYFGKLLTNIFNIKLDFIFERLQGLLWLPNSRSQKNRQVPFSGASFKSGASLGAS
jgi:hypothetical protein